MEHNPLLTAATFQEETEFRTLVKTYWNSHPVEYQKLLKDAKMFMFGLEYFTDTTPLDPKVIAENARKIVGTKCPKVSGYDDQKLTKVVFNL